MQTCALEMNKLLLLILVSSVAHHPLRSQLTYQQLTIPRAWKRQSCFLARVLNSRARSLYGHVTFSDSPFRALSYD